MFLFQAGWNKNPLVPWENNQLILKVNLCVQRWQWWMAGLIIWTKEGEGMGDNLFCHVIGMIWILYYICIFIYIYIYTCILYDGMIKSTGHILYIPSYAIIYIGKVIRILFDIVFVVPLMEESCKSLLIVRISLLIGWYRIFFLQPVSTGLMGVVHQYFGMKLIKLIIHQSPIHKGESAKPPEVFRMETWKTGAPT